MLHLEFVEKMEFPGDHASYLGDRRSWRMEMCRALENYYYIGHSYLRKEEAVRFLEEVYGIRWIDNFTIGLPNGDGSFTPAPPTAIPVDGQGALQVVSHSIYRATRIIVVRQAIFNYDLLVWISKNCKNDIYMKLSLPDVEIPTEGCTKLNEMNVIDFIYRGGRYRCSYNSMLSYLKRDKENGEED